MRASFQLGEGGGEGGGGRAGDGMRMVKRMGSKLAGGSGHAGVLCTIYIFLQLFYIFEILSEKERT